MDTLQLTLLEKDKYISSLEWQLVDSEATITSVQAERDRLALELDCALVREQDSDLQALGAVGDLSGYSEPVEHTNYGLVESGYVDDMPVRRVRKQPRRHLSDLTTRGNSYFDDFGALLLKNVLVPVTVLFLVERNLRYASSCNLLVYCLYCSTFSDGRFKVNRC